MSNNIRELIKEEKTRFDNQIQRLIKRVRVFVLGYRLRIRTNGKKLICQMKFTDGWANVSSVKQQ